MKRKIFCILTAVILCLGLCPAGALAAEENAPAPQAAGTPTRTERLELFKLTDPAENAEEGWKWEPGTCTLTLKNCYIQMENALVIRFPGSEEAHLVLEGENVIETSSTSFNPIITSDNGSLKHLKVSGSGSLTVSATAAGLKDPPYLFACRDLTIERGVSIRTNMDVSTISGTFTLNGGSVALSGEYVKYGIYANAGDVVINSGDLTINAGTVGMFLPGIPPTTRTSCVRISGGTVNISAPVSAIHINHKADASPETEQIVITGGEVNLTANDRALQGNTITVGENAKLNIRVKNGDGLLVSEGRKVTLAAGTYTGSANAINISAADTTLADLLAADCAFYRDSVSQANLITDTTGTALTGTVVVDRCVHTPLTGNQNGTHGGSCAACGKTFTSAPCTYEFTASGSVHTGVCSACGSKVKITVTGTDGLIYDGTEHVPAVSVTLDGRDLTQGTDYTVTVSGKDAGEITAVISGTGSYHFTKEIAFTVAPKPLTVTGASAANRAYDGAKEVTVTAVTLDSVLDADKGNVSVDTANLKGTISGADAGTYTSVTLPELTLTGTAAGNYTLTQPTGAVPASVVISPAAYAGTKTANTSAKFGAAGTYDLTALLQGIDGAAPGTPAAGAGSIFNGDPSLSGKVLSYQLKGDAAAGGSGTITVPVTSKNYLPFDLSIHVTVSSKAVPALTVSPITVTYTGEPVPDSAIRGTAKAGDTTVPGTWSFAAGQALTAVADSGVKTVTFTPDADHASEYAEAEATAAVTINKADPAGTPTYTAVTSGGKTLADAALTAPAGWPSGALSWVEADTTEVTANTQYEWTFIPTDSENYNTLTGRITLWTQSTGGGSGSTGGSSGGGSGSSGSTGGSSVTVPVSGSQNTVRVSASVTGSTASVSKIDTAQIDHVTGETGRAGMVEIDFTGLGRTIDTVKLPAGALRDVADKARSGKAGGLAVKLSEGEISLDAGALAGILDQAQAGSPITLTVTPAKAAQLNSRQRAAAGSSPVFELTLQSGGRIISDLRGGRATVSLPFSPAAGQDPNSVKVWFLDGSGNTTPCETRYDPDRRAAVFTTGHLSLYLVRCDSGAAWENPYADVSEAAWYYDAVRYAGEQGLMGGYGNGSFGPNDNLTRAQFAQILFNREGRPVVNYLMQFGDVPSGAWYTEAVRWASSQGIAKGYGSGNFGPNDNITREQLAVMLWRYAGSPAASGQDLPFTDRDRAGGFALEALGWAAEKGVLSGYQDGRLNPKGLATRAQTAQMLMNFLEN